MIKRSGHNRTKKVCSVCAKRKVKCDRLVPCGNCVKRGQESECIKFATLQNTQDAINATSDYLPNVLNLWQNYEYWILDIGLFKTQSLNPRKALYDLESNIQECEFWMNYLNTEQSFELLNFTVENLGALYFGCLGDINDLFSQLEQYWRRRDKKETKDDIVYYTSDDYYWNALLWAIFAMCIYYIPMEELEQKFSTKPICDWLEIDDDQGWTESLQLTIFQGFVKCSLVQLQKANFFAYPDIRIIQSFLILETTSFASSNYAVANALLIHCIHVGRLFNIDFNKQYSEDDPLMGISKSTFSKIWFRLCTCDYYHSSPTKRISCHTDMPTLLQHAAFYQDMPNVNIYKAEENFEALCWKIVSLDRDLDQYLTKTFKPQIKTLDAVKREIGILQQKITNKGHEEDSINSQFERFIASFLSNMVSWKLQKMYLIYFETANSLELSIHYSEVILSLIRNNIKSGNSLFNKHPLILSSLSRIVSFYAFYNIFSENVEVERTTKDLHNLITQLPIIIGEKVNGLLFVIDRFYSLKVLWEKVQIVDSALGTIHPVFKILQNDIKFISKFNNRTPILMRGVKSMIPNIRGVYDDEEFEYMENEEDELDLNINESNQFKLIVSEFQSERNIKEIFI